MRLLLARHGESVWNQVRRFQGAADVPLSDRGRAQARALGRAIAGYRLAAAYVSPLGRARETAEIALAKAAVPVTPVEELRELSLGEWEGCLASDIQARDGDPYRAWLRAPADCAPPGAEPLDAVRDRVLRAVARIAAAHPNGDDVLVVAHGGVISVYVCHLLGCDANALWRLRLDNASLTVVRPPRITTLNETRHLAGIDVVDLLRAEGAAGHRDRPPAGSAPRVVDGGSAATGGIAADVPSSTVAVDLDPADGSDVHHARAPLSPARSVPGEASEGAVEAPSE